MTVDVSDVCCHVAQATLFDRIPGKDFSLHDMSMAGVPYCENPADPLALIPRAARGDLAAQREIAEQALYYVLSEGDRIDRPVTLAEGLMFARMAASQTDDERDAMRVVMMLSLASLITVGEASTDYAAECIARLEMVADGATTMAEAAASLLARCAEQEKPETLMIARQYRDRLKGDA
ncbi:MAG: hypothetical protein M0R03_14395 [Novosphingobium sp.]|nr:hypothetical protein [Novosphingobium sp.]